MSTTYPEFQVWPYQPIPYVSGEVPTQTSLFRQDSMLQAVTDLALCGVVERPATPLHVLSVGSSFGAEADSVGAYVATEYRHLGRISITGVDVNQRVLDQAGYAKYRSTGNGFSDTQPLELLGITRLAGIMDISSLSDGRYPYLIDASRIRQRHTVRFLKADLSEEQPPLPEANIIFCNNLVYHLKPEQADRLVDTMAGYLALNGVMSFGVNRPLIRMNHDSNQVLVSDWTQRMSKRLATRHIEPVLINARTHAPIAYRRVA